MIFSNQQFSSRIILNEINCFIFSCLFINIQNSYHGAAIYFSQSVGNFSIKYSIFNNCKTLLSESNGGTFYLNCLNIDNFGNQIFNCYSDHSSIGFSRSSNLNLNECFSNSFCSGNHRAFDSNNGNIIKKSINFSYMIILGTGVVDRCDPSIGCNVNFLNFIHNKPAAEINIEGVFKNYHYYNYINIYNCSNRDGFCITINSQYNVIFRYLYASFYFPKTMIRLVSIYNPKVYDSILEQTTLNSNFNAGNNSLGYIFTHNDFINYCKFFKINQTLKSYSIISFFLIFFNFLLISLY